MPILSIIPSLMLFFFLGTNVSIPSYTVTADEVINEVNTLRISKGLQPYTVDAGMMAYAQQHADYMASMKQGTHTHSDGSIPWQQGIHENVASGTAELMDSAFIVYQIWADDIHMKTMVGYDGGEIGVGVAFDGVDQWISLDVRTGPALISTPADSSTDYQTTIAPETPEPIIPVQICTPQPDGSIIHTIGYGQTLYQIANAYQVPLQSILDMNGLKDTSAMIYAGQRLLIRIAPTATNTPTITETPPERTSTPRPSSTSYPTITHFVPSETPTPAAAVDTEVNGNSNQALTSALILTGIILVGLFAMYFLLFRKSNR